MELIFECNNQVIVLRESVILIKQNWTGTGSIITPSRQFNGFTTKDKFYSNFAKHKQNRKSRVKEKKIVRKYLN